MRNSLIVKDGFCSDPESVRRSALESGFGSWRPSKGKVGSSVYDGMNFEGDHALMLLALSQGLGGIPIYPRRSFFRITTPETERAYIHSDRSSGSWTCVAYLSEHEEESGTQFYRHRQTGLFEMPTFAEMEGREEFDELKKDMIHGGYAEWKKTHFVCAQFNSAVIFHAPLFHSRFPLHGIGDGKPENSRMVWVSHFEY